MQLKKRFIVDATSVGRASDCWAGGRGLKPQTGPQTRVPGKIMLAVYRSNDCFSSDNRVIGQEPLALSPTLFHTWNWKGMSKNPHAEWNLE